MKKNIRICDPQVGGLHREWIPNEVTQRLLDMHHKARLEYLSELLDKITTSDILTRPNVQDYLGTTDTAIKNWVSMGIIDEKRINGKPKYNRADILRIADKVYCDEDIHRLIMD